MWHKPCRTFHPWCLCIKTRCLSIAKGMILALGLRSQGYGCKTWNTHPGQNFSEYPLRALSWCNFSGRFLKLSWPLKFCFMTIWLNPELTRPLDTPQTKWCQEGSGRWRRLMEIRKLFSTQQKLYRWVGARKTELQCIKHWSYVFLALNHRYCV